MKTAPALPLQQHPAFACAIRRLGRKVVVAAIPGAAHLQTVQIFGQRLASRGPVWVSGTGDAAKIRGLRDCQLRLVNAESPERAAFRAAGFRQLLTGASIAELDLSGTAATRQAAMLPKWRNRWRHAARQPVQIMQEPFDFLRHQWLLQADLAQQRAKRFRGLPHALLIALTANDPRSVTVFSATQAGNPIAAMLFIKHHPVATYHLGWRNPDARDSSLHHRLLQDATECFAQEGYARMDLGLVDTVQSPGLARFKIGSGAQVRKLGGTWLRI